MLSTTPHLKAFGGTICKITLALELCEWVWIGKGREKSRLSKAE
jgi:hypothetical protein